VFNIFRNNIVDIFITVIVTDGFLLEKTIQSQCFGGALIFLNC